MVSSYVFSRKFWLQVHAHKVWSSVNGPVWGGIGNFRWWEWAGESSLRGVGFWRMFCLWPCPCLASMVYSLCHTFQLPQCSSPAQDNKQADPGLKLWANHTFLPLRLFCQLFVTAMKKPQRPFIFVYWVLRVLWLSLYLLVIWILFPVFELPSAE